MSKPRVGAATHTGRHRVINQDSYLVDETLFAVADGMGGHKGGEVASRIALEALSEIDVREVGDLVIGVDRANDAVFSAANEDPDLAGMGTTLVATAIMGDDLLGVVNIGDSRIYVYNSGHLHQVSKDHSLVETLVRQGQITPEVANAHPQRNVLLRALGVDPEVSCDAWVIRPAPGDRVLLCSDGLFNELSELEISEVLESWSQPQPAAQELVRLANEAGGRDNITCLVIDFDGEGRVDPVAGRLTNVLEAPEDPILFTPANTDTGEIDLAEPIVSTPKVPPNAELGQSAEPEPLVPTAAQIAAAGRTASQDTNGADEGAAVDATTTQNADADDATLRWPKYVGYLFGILALVGAAVLGVWWYGTNSWYVGADEESVCNL